VKLTDLATLNQVIDAVTADAEIREEWDRTAFAREVAIRIVRFRAERGLTQTDVARMIGMQQSVIARLERGENPPSLATLARISSGTGIEFDLRVRHGTVVLS
jgi:ribosome-binding protein aMBF1 (putative translation factor)